MEMKNKFRMFCTGENTYFELGGKSMGKGVTSISFSQNGGESANLGIGIDLGNFEFDPDGAFDEAMARLSPAESKLSPLECLSKALNATLDAATSKEGRTLDGES